MVLRTQQAEVNLNEAINAVLTSSPAVCAQMCVAMQGELSNECRRVLTERELETKRTMTDVQMALVQDSADVDQGVGQCAAVLRN